MVVISRLPVFGLATFSLIVAVLVLSFLSLAFILHLRQKCIASPPLLRFSSLWTVRILLVSSSSLWSVSQLIPIFGGNPFLCQLHVTLSLGFLEPSILLTLLFLLNSSTKPPPCAAHLFSAVLFSCLPMLVLQTMFVFFSPFDDSLPELFTRSSYTSGEGPSQTTVCTYPLMSTIVFGCFGIIFWMGFALSSYKIIRIVINKGLLLRTHAIALGVIVPLPLEIMLLVLNVLCIPGTSAHSGVTFGVFLCTLAPAVAGEGILVISPIVDALAAGGECCTWNPRGDDHGGSMGTSAAAIMEEDGSEAILNRVA
ncbi:hypothetical protein MLD38_033482 [Melastoma candidum]|uniref:Uncharacterized protein n=1 Tax=Melastoma candidum TaxID=119954 RepID=A0ACB9M6L3_9MYRT|nr:hypothetical protein MLD38_033482 [Melastoma candidum]